MNKLLLLTIMGLVAMSVTVFTSHLLLSKHKKFGITEGKLHSAFAIKFISVLSACSTMMKNSITALTEAIDYILRSKHQNVYSEILQFCSLYIGLAVLCFLLFYGVSSVLVITVLGNRKDIEEMEGNHNSYFLIKGIVLLALTICMAPVFDLLLHSFIPQMELPFYH